MIFRIAALGIGALAMYYFDPVSGNRRRALLRDKMTHYQKEARRYAEGTMKHARNKAKGMAHDIDEGTKQSDPGAGQRPDHWPVDVELRR